MEEMKAQRLTCLGLCSSVLSIAKSTETEAYNMATILKEVKFSQRDINLLRYYKTIIENHNIPYNLVFKNV